MNKAGRARGGFLCACSPGARIACFGATGSAFGLGLLFLVLFNAPSYLTDDPKVCINCHVMVPEYASWERGSHREVAHCVDCHIPHENFARKWAFKGASGAKDTFVFLTRGEDQVITLTNTSKRIIQDNCLRCHERQTGHLGLFNAMGLDGSSGRWCADCHRETAHGRARGLSSTPYVLYPRTKPLGS